MMRKWRHETARRVLDAVFPPACVGCGKRATWLCSACCRRVEWLRLPLCGRCRQPLDPQGPPHGCHPGTATPRSISAAGIFAGPLREAIHALKFHGRHGVAFTLAQEVARRMEPLLCEGDLLAPVPLHPTRQRERGYNQSAILASELTYLLSVETVPDALRRTRPTAQQVDLQTAADRAANVRGAFEARRDAVESRRVWLIDDVCTTGSTLSACTSALHAAGAREVRAAVVSAVDRSR